MTAKQNVLEKYPRAYSFKRTPDMYYPYEIVSHPDHLVSRIIGSSYISFKDAWKKACELVELENKTI